MHLLVVFLPYIRSHGYYPDLSRKQWLPSGLVLPQTGVGDQWTRALPLHYWCTANCWSSACPGHPQQSSPLSSNSPPNFNALSKGCDWDKDKHVDRIYRHRAWMNNRVSQKSFNQSLQSLQGIPKKFLLIFLKLTSPPRKGTRWSVQYSVHLVSHNRYTEQINVLPSFGGK